MKNTALLLLLASIVLAGCSSNDVSSKDQANKAAALDAKVKQSPDADKVEK